MALLDDTSLSFNYVDFGPRANFFLQACGVQKEPTPAEVAALLVKNPAHFLAEAGSSETYVHSPSLRVDYVKADRKLS